MIAGRYAREREIGRGGMGAVWLGRDEVLGRPVAIKRIGIAPGAASPDAARAEREARIAASLNHPHIVGVFDLVTEDEQQWMVMEYVEGATLSELVSARGPLSPDDAAVRIAQAASALAAAHASGVVHRDVKPSNILVRSDGHVKLTDFGIARNQADAALTQTGLVTGSPGYLAPEVASGQQATSASDVWSLGATLFHALTGHPPYDATGNVLGTLYRIVHEEPPRVEDPGWLGPLLEATMNRAPEERWTMVDIERFLDRDGEGLAAVPGPALGATLAAGTPARDDATLATPSAPIAPIAPVSPATATSLGTQTAAGSPGTRRAGPGRRRAVLPAVIGVVVALLVVAIAVLVLRDDPQRDTALDPGGGAASPTVSATPSPTPDPPSPTPTAPAVPTTKELRDFVASYLSLASSDPARAFQLLTPAFQRESTQYEEFWGSVSNPRLLKFSADPANLTVSYTYRYQRRGMGTQVDPVQLQLVATDDGFLIAGEL